MFGELEDADIKDVLGVDMVAFVEFDIEEGTVLTHQHPDTAAAMSASVQFLANCCLPDGSHFHQTDQSYLILPTQDGDIKYGIGFFRNKSDKTVSRGAIQRALLVISRYPHFHLFEQASYEILEASMEDTCNQMDLLKRLYNAFQIEEKKISTTEGLDCAYHHAPVTVFDHTYSFNIPVYYPKCKFLGTTSLVSLLSIVKDSILHIWYYLLREKRILFVGEKAQSVGMCCLTACLLIQPLIADETSIIPYITLPDIDVLLSKKQYIAGTTNQLLLQREAWYDLAIDLTTGQVFEGNKEKVKYTKTDKIFVKHLFQQTESDAWIEDQFNQFTLNFLLNYRDNESKKLQKLFPNFRDSQLYKNFMASKENRTILRKFKEKKDAMQQSKLKSSASIELRPNARQKNAVKRLSASIKHYSIISKPHKLREPKNLNTSVSLNCMSSQDETLKPNEDRTIQFSSIQEDSSTVEHTEESNGIERRRYKYKKEPRPKSEGDMSSFGKNSSIIEISDMEEEELFWIAAQDSDTS